MPFFGLMTVRAHEAELATAKNDRAVHVEWLEERNSDLSRTVSGLRIQMETHRELQKGFDRRFQKMQAELATLRPDAEKHRERVRKATMNLKQNRAKAGVVA